MHEYNDPGSVHAAKPRVYCIVGFPPRRGGFSLVGYIAQKTRKIGRDAERGQFIPVKDAERKKKTAVVETVKTPTEKGKK